MLGFLFIDPLYLLFAAPGLVFAMWAQWRVKATVSQWSQVATRRGMTGRDAAQAVLTGAGIRDVQIEMVDGWLSDHYDPREKKLRLSHDNFHGRSVAAFGIAAHEAGHAIQHATGYVPLTIRAVSVPAASIGSWLAFPIIIIGAMLSQFARQPGGLGGLLVLAGICLFSLTVFFQLVTVPVELDASRRAKDSLSKLGLLSGDEGEGAARVLSAAAWTYVAAAASSILMLIYLIVRYGGAVGGGSRSNNE